MISYIKIQRRLLMSALLHALLYYLLKIDQSFCVFKNNLAASSSALFDPVEFAIVASC
jgi:hypothetical protein